MVISRSIVDILVTYEREDRLVIPCNLDKGSYLKYCINQDIYIFNVMTSIFRTSKVL